MNREAWLQGAVEELRPLFRGKGFEVPELHVSCGFPSRNATGTKKRSIGECWDGLVSADGKPQLFISPFLVETDVDKLVVEAPMALEQGVLATLVHEMVHATIGTEAKHGPKFRKAMDKLGLAGKPTATIAGPDLQARLAGVIQHLGNYPHAALTLKRERKVQTTRMRRCECSACGFLVRLTQKWADVGAPICPVVGHGPMTLEEQFNDNPDGGADDE